MVVPKQYQADVEGTLAKRHDNGGDLWTTPDQRLGKGSSFSTLNCALMLSELGVDISEPVLKDAAQLILSAWREDGRFRLAPRSAIYPCHTVTTARTLCRLGYGDDPKLAPFSFCKKGAPGDLATARYQEILKNLGRT